MSPTVDSGVYRLDRAFTRSAACCALSGRIRRAASRYLRSTSSRPRTRPLARHALSVAADFLSEELLRYPEWLSTVADLHQQISTQGYKQRLQAFLAERHALKPAALDLGVIPAARTGSHRVARPAGVCVAAEKLPKKFPVWPMRFMACALASVSADDRGASWQGLWLEGRNVAAAVCTVLALGKLGGRELNYSSDIDLMFLLQRERRDVRAARHHQ
jgi:glutamate-ammonia-ligase adenylyltransferase